MKKILFCIPTLDGGGAEKVLVNLVNNLNEKEFDITVFTLFDGGVNIKKLKPNIKHLYYFRKIFHGNIYLLKIFKPSKLFKIMIKDKYDIIVSYLEGPTTRIVSGCNDNNTKIINWVHTEVTNIREFKKVYRSMNEMKKCYHKYSETIFVSKTAEDAFKNSIMKDINTRVIYNTIDDAEIKMASMDCTPQNFKKDENLKIISIGRLTKVKGYKRLLNIHKELIAEGINHSLYLLGEGSQRKELENFIKINDLERTVHLLGYQDNPYKYIKESDLYVCSSYKEGYNTAVIEALIIGVPIITTNCSGMAEILDNGKYGIITENNLKNLKLAIKEMITSKEKMNTYKRLSKIKGNDFSKWKSIKQIEDFLINL